MNIVHLHLLLNHAPVIGAVFAMLLLVFALLRHSDELVRAAFAIFTLLGALAIVVFLTGEPAEDIAEKLPGFSKSLTEQHEEVALVATVMMAAFGALTMLALWIYRKRVLPRGIVITACVVSLGVTGTMGYVANLGGQIRHTEIRTGSTIGNGGGDEARERAERP